MQQTSLRDWLIKIAVALVAVAIAITAIAIYRQNHDPAADADGGIVIELVDLTGKTEQYPLTFEEGDRLIDLLLENFDVKYEDGQYGFVLMGINHLQTDFTTSYIAIYVNGEYANYGLSSITLEKGCVYSFREEKI